MSSQIQITLRRIDHSEALESRIRALAARLERHNGEILSCRVLVEAPHQSMHQGGQFVARLEIKVPGAEIVVNRDHHQDVYVALRDAFDAAGRQLADYVGRRRGRADRHAGAAAGVDE
jgi:ribosomal subunit interface protein